MQERYIERSIEQVLRRAAREFPTVVVTGPRQSGKTTLLKHLLADTYQYVVHPGDVTLTLGSGVTALPLAML